MKRFLSIVMICALLLLALPVAASAAPAAGATPPAIPTSGDKWDGKTEKPTETVKKDNVRYYKITKCAQLAYVAQTGGAWLGYNYLLADDLILNDVALQWDADGEDSVLCREQPRNDAVEATRVPHRA